MTKLGMMNILVYLLLGYVAWCCNAFTAPNLNAKLINSNVKDNRILTWGPKTQPLASTSLFNRPRSLYYVNTNDAVTGTSLWMKETPSDGKQSLIETVRSVTTHVIPPIPKQQRQKTTVYSLPIEDQFRPKFILKEFLFGFQYMMRMQCWLLDLFITCSKHLCIRRTHARSSLYIK